MKSHKTKSQNQNIGNTLKTLAKNTKSHPDAILSLWGRNPVAQKHKIPSGRDFELVGSKPGGPKTQNPIRTQ
jgi:hypothetical protein